MPIQMEIAPSLTHASSVGCSLALSYACAVLPSFGRGWACSCHQHACMHAWSRKLTPTRITRPVRDQSCRSLARTGPVHSRAAGTAAAAPCPCASLASGAVLTVSASAASRSPTSPPAVHGGFTPLFLYKKTDFSSQECFSSQMSRWLRLEILPLGNNATLSFFTQTNK